MIVMYPHTQNCCSLYFDTAMGLKIRATLRDIDPLNKVPSKRATSRVQKGPFQGVSLIYLGSQPVFGFGAEDDRRLSSRTMPLPRVGLGL